MSSPLNVSVVVVAAAASMAFLCAFSAAPADAAVVPLAAVKAVSQCSSAPAVVDCLMRAAAAGVDALTRSAEPVDLVPGCVTLVKNVAVAASDAATVDHNGRATPTSSTATVSAEPEDGGAEAALIDSVTAFAKSRAITVRAPIDALDALKSSLIQARGKKDKYAGPLLMGAMMVAGTLLPIKLGALAMMSGKALMTSMLALMLSAILALKKLASGGGGHSGTTYEVINVPSHGGHGGHGRSLYAQTLAYTPPAVDEVTTATASASDSSVTR